MEHLRIAIAAVLTPELAARLAAADERFEVDFHPELLPAQRFASDSEGDKASFHRSPDEQARYEAMCNSADALFGLPDNSSKALAACVAANPGLRWVHTMAAGGGSQVRGARLAAQDLQRVVFTTSAGVHAAPLAEYALFGALCGVKGLPRLLDQQARKEWTVRWPVRQIADLTVLVVGMGNIGREVAARFLELGAEVVGANRSLREVPGVEMHLIDDLADLAPRADVLVNCLPGAVGTEGLISAEVLGALPQGATLVSLGRGNCIDEPALIEGLSSGPIGFAALDVTAHEPLSPESPLWTLPNVLISPHTMALSDKELDRILDLFIDNAKALLEGRRLRNVVNTELFY